ncbi:MAG: TrbI/VirB10 family protein, partial [Bacteroidota bacterium]
IAYAQNRLLVSWSRLILPNGKSLALEGMAGIDNGGYAGLKDKVNNHWDKIIAGALVTSLFGAGSKMLSAGDNDTTESYEQLAASGAATSLAEAGSKVFEKNLNIQPTIEITPGTKFNIFVDRDLILESYQNGR